ncbi:MAG: acyl transferase [Bacteroidetes bacterium GWE2_39_28]|nr:MAG: acyl transferase [Bacteroidetes bacterium GWE2_39_28]OFY13598.1 MAG: acyl transferase [Bacteroidetes bacterium GWF2_39_10]OFZ09396.1 MAG: acyl transferase [Bacteroidetes bacterium RIFOXYB2_FULL_39_7]OFZ11756.1 MAG: acyl transferase [Bacteroidetes bacterium RIFOXYC2_FULL_39_11]HCT94942.1 acyl transferase [Rikenellaceae bacterium]
MKDKIFNISSREEYEKIALEIFRIQSEQCTPYKDFITLTGVNTSAVNSIEKIPFLPVSLFKSHSIICQGLEPEIVFTSSATSGMIPSSHPVADLSIYKESFSKAFRLFWGEPSEYAILALLPSYLEREGSSLVYMVDNLIKESCNSDSGFYLYDFDTLYHKLVSLKERGVKTLLLGVSFALLEFIDQYQINFPQLIVMETGGMKGRGKEISRDQLHSALRSGFGVSKIASEYGMAELLSQAYSYGDGLFETPPWMEILIRDLSNPFRILNGHATGGINIIDLANLNSCSFIETQDMGKKETGNTFSISGRIQNSELRGCNLLLEQ